jgi:tetratricopeptide (TPR) repeat protein
MLRSLRSLPFLFALVFALALVLIPAPSHALPEPSGKPPLPPNISTILDHIYSGRSDLALPEIRQLQQQDPGDPLGYLLEAEAEWWKIWCEAAEFRYGMTMARHRERVPADKQYLELTAKAYSLAGANLRRQDSGEMRLYAGMADALAARLYGLRAENHAAARAGVRARGNFLAALALDPSLCDAYLGLGLYNYYVDTLSAMARILRFFMGIPGGNKEEGIRQLQRAIREGQLTPAAARFYLAIDLHNYEQRYEEALAVIGPLVDKYPENPMFQLARGDLYAKLGQKKLAEACYRAAGEDALNVPEAECREKIGQLVRQSLKALHVS